MMKKVSRVREVFKKSEVFKGSKRKKGFTLVELLVVLSIVALILLVAVSQYRSFKDVKDKAKAEQIANVLRQLSEATYIYYIDFGTPPNDVNDLLEKKILRIKPQVNADNDNNQDTISFVKGNFNGNGKVDLYIEVTPSTNNGISTGVCEKLKEIASEETVKCSTNSIKWLVALDIQ